MHKIILLRLFLVGVVFIGGLGVSYTQTFNLFEADFVMKEKYKSSDVTSLIKGNLFIDNTLNFSEFYLIFPYIEKWVLKDSVLSLIENDTITKTVNIGEFSEVSFLREVSSKIKIDYGLSEIGFTEKKVTFDDEIGVIIDWEAPKIMNELFGGATTHVKNNMLTSVNLFNTNNEIILSTFFEDYIFVKNLPVPQKIKSKIVGDSDIVYKSLEFKNIKINHK